MQDVTEILSRATNREPAATDALFAMVYEELRELARKQMLRERPDHTLQTTALVHEAYLRMVSAPAGWESRGHFFAAAAEAMRRILIDAARAKGSLKRGQGRKRESKASADLLESANWDPDLLLDLEQGIGRLSESDRQAAELVKLRLFAGLSITEAGECLGLSRSVAYRAWEFARAWFAVHGGELSE
jgi:RNA polymerase sigma factor (TIGR02999 family)